MNRPKAVAALTALALAAAIGRAEAAYEKWGDILRTTEDTD